MLDEVDDVESKSSENSIVPEIKKHQKQIDLKKEDSSDSEIDPNNVSLSSGSESSSSESEEVQESSSSSEDEREKRRK